MTVKRMQVREHLRLGAFFPPDYPILVTCEKCGQCASLLRFLFPREPQMVWRYGRCSCLHCGHQWMMPAGFHFPARGPLWLKTPCCGNVLWILNREHLEFMEQFIGATLREERMEDRSSRRLSSALPRWMLSAKNRPGVVRGLKKLRKKLEQTRLS